MKSALLRFAPAYDARHFLDDATDAPEYVVGSAAIKRVRLDEPTPIVVDHDRERVIGHAREMYVREDVDYGTRLRNWWFASCEITDAPGWLKREGGVSWSYKPLHTRTIADTTVIESCLIEEISVLAPATKPAEPLARVAWVGEPPKRVPIRAHRRTARSDLHGELDELRRRIDWYERQTGRTADVALLKENMEAEVYGRQMGRGR